MDVYLHTRRKTKIFSSSRRIDGPPGQSENLGKGQMPCKYQIRNPDFSACRINSLLSSIVIVFNDFRLSGIERDVLTLNDERYLI